MYWQLVAMHADQCLLNVACSPDVRKGAVPVNFTDYDLSKTQQLKRRVLEIMLQTARDFATREILTQMLVYLYIDQ